MGLRPGWCYTRLSRRPNTRSSPRKPRKSYVKGVPGSKIFHYETGDRTAKFPKTFHLVSKQDIQIRHNSLEATRVTTTKYLTNKLTAQGFFFKVLVYPHHIMRENAMATGAGADRYSQGMRRSFGKPVGRAARVSENQHVLTVKTNEGKYDVVKEAFRRASTKLPGLYKIIQE